MSGIQGITVSVFLRKIMECFLGRKLNKEAIPSDFSTMFREKETVDFP